MAYIVFMQGELQQQLTRGVSDWLTKRHGYWKSENAKHGYVVDSV